MKNYNKPIDWHYWQNMQEVALWQACLLSLNMNPDAMQYSKHSWMMGPYDGPHFELKSFPSDQDLDNYRKRLNLLKSNLPNREHFSPGKVNMESSNSSGVKLPEFAAWIKGIGLSIPDELEAIACPPMVPPTEERQQGTRWLNHETTKLTALRLAANRFWGNYDPKDRSTAPKNADVADWLRKTHAIPASVAEQMASILRPDDLKPGPR